MKKLMTVAFVSVLALRGCGKKAAETQSIIDAFMSY